MFKCVGRYSCGIPHGDLFIIIGGSPFESRVSEYSNDGWAKDIGNLNTGRERHACAKYTNDDGKDVSRSRK